MFFLKKSNDGGKQQLKHLAAIFDWETSYLER